MSHASSFALKPIERVQLHAFRRAIDKSEPQKMNSRNYFLLSFFFLLFRFSDAFNITQFLSQYPHFTTFNNYLTQTQLAGDINSRQTITLLAVDNDNIAPLSGKPDNVLKAIMSVHVILDYYDVQKLQNLANKTTIVTTLYQTSGRAVGQQGFLNITDLATGSVVIGSAAKGATLAANLVKPIAAQPYNISVLQISTVIIPLGIDNTTNSPPPQAPPPAPSPSPSHKSPSPAPSPTHKSPPPAPSPSHKSPPPATTPAPGMSPRKSPPSPSPSTVPPVVSPPMPSKAPAPSPPPQPNAPTADAPAADNPALPPPASTGNNDLRLSLVSIFLIVSSALWFVVMI